MTPQTPAQERFRSLVTMTKSVAREHLIKEADYVNTKWFEYRYTDPYSATILFGRHYNAALRRFVEKYINIDFGPHVRGVDIPATAPSREFTQLWVARQHADEVQLPYDQYISHCLEFAVGRSGRKVAAPRPNQLRPTHKSDIAWKFKFAEKFDDYEVTFTSRLSSFQQLRVENYHSLPAQRGQFEHMKQIAAMGRQSWLRTAEHWSVELRLLPLRAFRTELSIDQMRGIVVDARRVKGGLTSTATALSKSSVALWQSCFGVPGAQRECAPCCGCPQAEACGKMAELVIKAVARDTGTEDPILEAKRAAGRARTRKSRQKAKAAGALSITAGAQEL
ncbi:hypothetical protein VW23_001655 [Devosia insulae DS-56]|uniref:Uncharacterized protein n=1 Tax=Devosia insulae DS-56 TaxID=1116389 RepID=A0A1E5XMI1_9HYPH|nr:hypothetical protein [Devosia insulae]OEO29779.1 hypothetical protein VW23_001655 [Devosia insulae DS-56]